MIGFLAIFVPLSMAVVYGGMWLLGTWMDRECERCLREEPDNLFCCE